MDVVERRLQKLCKISEADEVVLFEKATFLVISHATNSDQQRDPHRFEKISNIIKQFKLSCSKSQSQFTSMEIHTSQFIAYIDEFTSNTYVMIILSDPKIRKSFSLSFSLMFRTGCNVAQPQDCQEALWSVDEVGINLFLWTALIHVWMKNQGLPIVLTFLLKASFM